MSKKSVILIILLLITLSHAFGQNQDERIIEEYKKDEFPQWVNELRRFEIIFFGSLPFSFFLAQEGYDLYRAFYHGFDNSAYTPWPFHSSNFEPYSDEENLRTVIIGLSVSLVIATADYFIGKLQSSKK